MTAPARTLPGYAGWRRRQVIRWTKPGPACGGADPSLDTTEPGSGRDGVELIRRMGGPPVCSVVATAHCSPWPRIGESTLTPRATSTKGAMVRGSIRVMDNQLALSLATVAMTISEMDQKPDEESMARFSMS